MHHREVGEAQALFSEIRTACLCDIERLLFLAASQYRRGCDLLHAGSASWALVTLYYSSFFSAKALLGMFGVWLDDSYVVMEVGVARPGSQKFRILRRSPSLKKGSHQRFWDEFYRSANNLKPWVDVSQHWVLGPIRGSADYLIRSRNSVNYDPASAIATAVEFQGTFAAAKFPACLRGDLGVQFSVAESLVVLGFEFAADFAFRTRALDSLVPRGTRGDKIRELVVGYAKADLTGRIRETELLR